MSVRESDRPPELESKLAIQTACREVPDVGAEACDVVFSFLQNPESFADQKRSHPLVPGRRGDAGAAETTENDPVASELHNSSMERDLAHHRPAGIIGEHH